MYLIYKDCTRQHVTGDNSKERTEEKENTIVTFTIYPGATGTDRWELNYLCITSLEPKMLWGVPRGMQCPGMTPGAHCFGFCSSLHLAVELSMAQILCRYPKVEGYFILDILGSFPLNFLIKNEVKLKNFPPWQSL